MVRRPLDKVSQRQLLDLLRVDIERAMLGDTRAKRRVLRLANDNPHSWDSTFVRYNLGKRKAAWLAGVMGAPDERAALPLRSDATPLVGPRS